MLKTSFVRKPVTLEDVYEGADWIRLHFGPDPHPYYVAAERSLSQTEWKEFTSDFLADREWVQEFSNQAHPMIEGAPGCLRITSPCSDLVLLVDTQGYSYARYVAIESPA